MKNEKLKLACITLDMEGDIGDSEKRIFLLENQAYFEKYLSIVKKYNIKVTVFTVTSILAKYHQRLMSMKRSIPLEFAVHSHLHDPKDPCGLKEVEMATETYRTHIKDHPIGFRAPLGKINKEGIAALIHLGYKYDASVYPTNPHWRSTPYIIKQSDKAIVELPLGSIRYIRLVFALSYINFFGWSLYKKLIRIFGLTDIAIGLTHPYNLYPELVKGDLTHLERFVLTKGANKGFENFENMLKVLIDEGYEFVFMSELLKKTKYLELPETELRYWK